MSDAIEGEPLWTWAGIKKRMSDEPIHVKLARQAAAKAQEAYDAAEESGNPYARAVVTEVLAEGGLISLEVARKALGVEN